MEAVILIGIQAAGKTTFYQRRFFDTHVRLSLDVLKTRHRERLLVAACIAAKQPFVLDNTNVLAAERERTIAPARAAGFRVVGYFFPPHVRGSLWRNRRRERGKEVPVQGILGTAKRLEEPRLTEGFDRLYQVRIDENGEFVVEG
jgi:predicted kinase